MQQEVEALFGFAEQRSYEAGDVVVKEGTPSDCLFILASGALEVVRESDGSAVVLATLTEKGTFFGEMSLIDIMPRSADIRATTSTQVLALPKKELTAFFTQSPRVQMTMILNISRNLSLRLRDADARIVELAREVGQAGKGD